MSTPAKRPALIFDFGNVLAFFDYTRACEVFGRRAGLSGPEFYEILKKRGMTPLSLRYEQGQLTSAEFFEAFRDLAGVPLDYDEFAAAWRDIFELNPPVVAIAAGLKAKGYPLALGSNTNELQADHFRNAFREALSVFDATVLSYQVKHLKPAAAFYHACAAALGAEPRECIFIDDLPDNVDGARRAGLVAIHYRDPASLLADLRSAGVEVDGLEGA